MDSYGAPQAPPVSYPQSYDSSYGAPQAPPISYDPNAGGFGSPYPAFFGDIELVMKLGQVALIAFIILVIVIVAFLLLMCCMYCPMLFGGGRQHGYQADQQGYYQPNVSTQAMNPKNASDEWIPPAPTTTDTSSENSTMKRGRTPKGLRRHKTGIIGRSSPERER